MEAANVPVIPGCSECIYEADHGKRIAGEVGYPVMIKQHLEAVGKECVPHIQRQNLSQHF